MRPAKATSPPSKLVTSARVTRCLPSFGSLPASQSSRIGSSSSIVRSQTAISASASSFIRRLPYIHQMDIDQRRSQALSTRASAASRETRTATWPRRSPPVAVAGEARSRARLQRRRELRRVAKPSRHADILELRPRALEQRSRALAIVRAAALEHERLVEVGDRAQRACTLLLEDDAGAGEP